MISYKKTCAVLALAALAMPIFLRGFARAQTSAQSGNQPGHAALVVMTEFGPVRGLIAGGARKFLGVPYAAPPTGDLRWKAPAPHASWTAAWDATRFRADCAQPSFVRGRPNHSSEDCLYLNIYTPNPAGRNLPVMFWIHGGSFLVGSGEDSDGSVLAAKGKVVIVTINYRLGAFGFLAHKALDAENPRHVSGNYGLLDQQAAMKWVQHNIGAFGGDPARVTIFGESAGGISVCLQLISLGARGLFARAINESGPCQMVQPIARAQAQGDRLVAALKCTSGSDTAACLRSKSTKQVQDALPSSPVGNNGVLWFPVVEGVVLPQSAEQAFTAGKFIHVPLINGSNHNEGTLFVAFGKPIDEAGYKARVQGFFRSQAARVMEEYPLTAYPNGSEAWAAVFTDSFFSCPVRRSTRALASQDSVYAYEFNDPKAPNTMIPHAHLDLRAYHSAEIQYVFQTRFPSYGKPGPAPLSPRQLELSNRMMDYWTSFAANGHPGGVPKWTPYQDTQDQVLSFAPDKIGYQKDFAREHHCAFWDSMKGTMLDQQ